MPMCGDGLGERSLLREFSQRQARENEHCRDGASNQSPANDSVLYLNLDFTIKFFKRQRSEAGW